MCKISGLFLDLHILMSYPFQAWICHCHLHPLQAANCCRNSRLVVDEDDFKWVENCRKLPCIGELVLWKSPSCRKIKSVFRDVKWCFNASRGLKGLNGILYVVFPSEAYLTYTHTPVGGGCAFLSPWYQTTLSNSPLFIQIAISMEAAWPDHHGIWINSQIKWNSGPAPRQCWANTGPVLDQQSQYWASIGSELARYWRIRSTKHAVTVTGRTYCLLIWDAIDHTKLYPLTAGAEFIRFST